MEQIFFFEFVLGRLIGLDRGLRAVDKGIQNVRPRADFAVYGSGLSCDRGGVFLCAEQRPARVCGFALTVGSVGLGLGFGFYANLWRGSTECERGHLAGRNASSPLRQRVAR